MALTDEEHTLTGLQKPTQDPMTYSFMTQNALNQCLKKKKKKQKCDKILNSTFELIFTPSSLGVKVFRQ